MTDPKPDQTPEPQVELSEDDLDTAVGGASQTAVKGIRDGTSNVVDGTSNT